MAKPNYSYEKRQKELAKKKKKEEKRLNKLAKKAEEEQELLEDGEYEKNFFNAVKIRIYGNLKQEFPSYYLEDFDDMEFADCAIEHLDGIIHRMHAEEKARE